ncbi:integrase/recombinase xerD homolog [Heteronotia binoei]|uniref:integrase/recombinase xerD homolog n=1 Tax=Heteronotia binoei TaxID=13085 RepID=UPI0029309A20|nr:integrase/recombinase xerD homolog [Heteronotia binoei]
MAAWEAEAGRAIQLALAPSTRRAYDRAASQFREFRRAAALKDCWPIPTAHIMQFSVYQKQKGLGLKTIRGQLAALAFISKAQGFVDSTADFRIRKMLEGWSRERGPRVDDRQPISPSVLKGLFGSWPAICSSTFEAALFHAASLVAFFGALRISELVMQSKTDFSMWALQAGDVKIDQGQVVLTIRRSKTDQWRKGSVITLGQCTVHELCPVRAVRCYVRFRGLGDGPLFRHEDGSPLTKYQFWAVTSRALAAIGLKGVKFGTHSFRIGAASTAASMGYTPASIQRIGRWQSTAFKSYVHPLIA